MTLEEMLKNSLLAAAKADIDDNEVTVEHMNVSTYEAEGAKVTVHADIKTAALTKLVIETSDDYMTIENDDVHSFITVMARVLKGMTSHQP